MTARDSMPGIIREMRGQVQPLPSLVSAMGSLASRSTIAVIPTTGVASWPRGVNSWCRAAVPGHEAGEAIAAETLACARAFRPGTQSAAR